MTFGQVQCDFCRVKFPASEFSEGDAVLLLGKKVCRLCVQKGTRYCHFCRAGISDLDFEEGRAVTLLGKRYCEKCLATAVERSKPSNTSGSSVGRPIDVLAAPSPSSRSSASAPVAHVPTGAELRAFERFVPPREARLFIKAPGLDGVLGKNRVRMWLDLSEGGARAIVQGSFEKGDEIDAEVRYEPLKARHPVVLKVRHAHPSKSFPDSAVVGFKFVDPDRELKELVRTRLKVHPLLVEQEAEPAPAPGASQSKSRAG
jgi:hypothetical protein